jgi:hypothetical protein
MNSRVLVVGLIAVIVFSAFLFKGKTGNDKVVQGVQRNTAASEENPATTLEGKVKSMGAVEVEVTPISVEPKSNMKFEIALNTHSVDLSYDYTDIISAEDDKGNVYKVISWSGGEGGHHLRGQIELEPILQEAGEITLIIDDIDDQKETFEWSL